MEWVLVGFCAFIPILFRIHKRISVLEQKLRQ